MALIGIIASIPVFVGLGAYAMHLLSLELDSKFYAAVDSIPTKVYSRIFWLRPTKLLSLAELRARLTERHYQEKPQATPLVQGTYHWSEAGEDGKVTVEIFLRNFPYPPSVQSLFFTDTSIGADREHSFIVEIKNSEILRVARREGDALVDIAGLALEPILIAQLNSNDRETRETVPIGRIPYTLLQAIVSVEDQRFLEHSGVDPRGILRSIWVNVRAGEYQQGASTITQQMVRNIYLTRQKTFRRKIKEMLMAIMIEYRFSKDQIIEKYLNEVYFGQIGNLEIRGVSQAAKHYFAKSLEQLSVAEQALLAALIRGPFYYSPFKHFERAKQRQLLVLEKMLESRLITDADFQKAKDEKLVFAENSTVLDRAPYFTDFVKAQLLKEIPDEELIGVGFNIFSTIDTYYQRQAEEAVEKGVAELEARLRKAAASSSRRAKAAALDPQALTPLQGAFLLLDPKTSNLLAIVGGRNYRESSYNRALYMNRQIGSIAKPFVFLAGLMYGKNPDGTPLNAVSKLEDSPYRYTFDRQVWEPKNYEPGTEGQVTLRYALAKSLNIPTARLAVATGLERVVEVMRSAGIDQDLQPLPSLSLGAVEVSPIFIARAYATLANLGVRREVTSILAITNNDGEPVAQFQQQEDQALPEAEVANLLAMMQSTFDYGTAASAKALGFQYPAAGKTGTTNEYRDSWFAGFTNEALAVAWVGYDRDDEAVVKQRGLQKLTGASGALPIWSRVMGSIHQSLPQKNLVIPDGLLREIEVDLISGGRVNELCRANNLIKEFFTSRNAPTFECR